MGAGARARGAARAVRGARWTHTWLKLAESREPDMAEVCA